MDDLCSVNIFNTYKLENSFTNGLFALMKLSVYEKPAFMRSMLKLLGIESTQQPTCHFLVRVLRGIDHADAELRVGTSCLRFETKINSGALADTQIRRRLRELKRCRGRMKRVVLLTPDDSKSIYIKRILKRWPKVVHIGWMRIFRLLTSFASGKGTFAALVKQYLERIQNQIFQQDYAGVITKVAFNDHTEVLEESYLGELKRDEWESWSTPRPYKELDGTGRKLLLYQRPSQHPRSGGITAEVEIKKVVNDYRRRFPSRNVFAAKPRVFSRTIPLTHIRSIEGFEDFGKYRKDRSPYRNITREQYAKLIEWLKV